jgi:hypothetical protein
MARRRIVGRFGGRSSYVGGGTGGLAPSFHPFLPYGTPPVGSYDPAVDAQVGAANRGLFDLGQDTQTANERDTTDYGLGVGDVTRSRDRSLADLATGRTRADEDHTRALAMLQRSYQQLGNRQLQGQARAGVLSGGAALQAAAKRQANQAIDQQPIDTSYKRFVDDNTLAQTRVGEDSDSALGRLALDLAPPGPDNPLGGRRFQDRTTQLTRGQRENTAFGLDANAQRAYQASGAGWDPGVKPKNEFLDPQGNPYRIVSRGGRSYGLAPSGKVLWQRARRRR